MSHRIIKDAAGAQWQVWSVSPGTLTPLQTLAVAPQFAGGWLAFERMGEATGPAEKRRLAPIPADWATAPEHEVRALLSAAKPVPPRQQTRH
jgi:hypothetical protein